MFQGAARETEHEAYVERYYRTVNYGWLGL